MTLRSQTNFPYDMKCTLQVYHRDNLHNAQIHRIETEYGSIIILVMQTITILFELLSHYGTKYDALPC